MFHFFQLTGKPEASTETSFHKLRSGYLSVSVSSPTDSASWAVRQKFSPDNKWGKKGFGETREAPCSCVVCDYCAFSPAA